jgi:hypothetical protein
MDADPDWPPQKTVWRGVLHQHAAGAALAGGIMLIIGAPSGRAKAGCAVYAGALCSLMKQKRCVRPRRCSGVLQPPAAWLQAVLAVNTWVSTECVLIGGLLLGQAR